MRQMSIVLSSLLLLAVTGCAAESAGDAESLSTDTPSLNGATGAAPTVGSTYVVEGDFQLVTDDGMAPATETSGPTITRKSLGTGTFNVAIKGVTTAPDLDGGGLDENFVADIRVDFPAASGRAPLVLVDAELTRVRFLDTPTTRTVSGLGRDARMVAILGSDGSFRSMGYRARIDSLNELEFDAFKATTREVP